jgi:hypothetical protein
MGTAPVERMGSDPPADSAMDRKEAVGGEPSAEERAAGVRSERGDRLRLLGNAACCRYRPG